MYIQPNRFIVVEKISDGTTHFSHDTNEFRIVVFEIADDGYKSVQDILQVSERGLTKTLLSKFDDDNYVIKLEGYKYENIEFGRTKLNSSKIIKIAKFLSEQKENS